MNNVDFRISDDSYLPEVDFISQYEAVLSYPCSKSDECSSYNFTLPPGKYLLKAYGASSGNQISLALSSDRNSCLSKENSTKYGGNAICLNNTYGGGSGALISGVLTLKRNTKCFVRIGGVGIYEIANSNGGFNGGGKSHTNGQHPSSSGGGATDFRIEVDDVYHRILVAGGGGGTDNNEGNGGAAGYPEGQGYWIKGVYNSDKIATQESGYSFGFGEPATKEGDLGGGGGGWFGGYASNSWTGGAGGGSSYALTKTSYIPTLTDGSYAFTNYSPYVLQNIISANGIWEGNGKMHIIRLNIINFTKDHQTFINISLFLFLIVFI